ncbi:Histone-lysine N-methyltransferase ATXR4 [Ananas comosus]|uniref:Histone-lysine N-methyltransferase ATXR4 n=1 Tax=Ananas comosus TaxID=4615 RepID=A0A199VV58_ANACO|nr:Histone-lysine N-methyltransferase ATXR4 [Ananas comosus]
MLGRQTINPPPLRSVSTAAGAADGAGDPPTRPGPPPIRVALTESAGRGVFATRAIGAGELVHSAKPLVAHPSPSHLRKVCYYCLRKKGSEVSLISDEIAGEDLGSNPTSYYFCSESCVERSKIFYEVERRADWSLYDDHCRLRGLKYPLMVKRLACMVISGAVPADTLDILQPATLPQEALLEMEEEFALLRHTFKKASLQDELIALVLTKQWYINVLARIRINAFRIELVGESHEDLFTSAAALVGSDVSVGNAVYMVPSFYNHDCDPNAHIVWLDNADAKLKALCDIEEGEELRICYIDASMNLDARQKILAEGFGFQCNCLRCLSGD